MTEWLHFHFSLSCTGEGNGNPLQCSCLENPRDGEPGGLPFMGSHRVGHDWSDLAWQSYWDIYRYMGFPCGSAGKESARNVGDLGSIPGLERSPREGKGYLLQYSGLENPVDCSLPGFSVHGITRVGHGLVTKPPAPYSPWSCKESNTTEQLCLTYRYILIQHCISFSCTA